MGRAGKYTTYNRIRLVLFTRSYACYSISQHLRAKYKISDRETAKELREKYFNKRTIPEISRLARVLNLGYQPLWQSIVLNRSQTSIKQISDKEKIKIYLCIEGELILLAAAKRNKSSYADTDYEEESAVLSTAIERAVGNYLGNINNDFIFEQQLADLQRVYRKWYYKIAYKYKMPTPRIIPFILRLIKN